MIIQLSCFNLVIRSAEDVKLVSTIRESVKIRVRFKNFVSNHYFEKITLGRCKCNQLTRNIYVYRNFSIEDAC